MKESIKIFAKEFIKPIIDILLYPIKLLFNFILEIESKYLVPIFIKLFGDFDFLKYLFPLIGIITTIMIIYIIYEDCFKE